MKKIIPIAIFLCTAASAQTKVGGTAQIGGTVAASGYVPTAPTISSLALSPSNSTIVATWTTNAPSTTVFACSTTSGGPYTILQMDGGTQASVTSHLAGLDVPAGSPTTYYCQATSANVTGSNSATASTTTTSAAATSPITSLVVGSVTPYNSINANNQGCADTFYNVQSSDGITYVTNDDTAQAGVGCSFSQSGVPAGVSASFAVAKFTSLSPYAIQTFNNMTAYGPCCTAGVDGNDQKDSGMVSVAGNLYLAVARQLPSTSIPAIPQYDGQVIMSPDHGLHWNNFQNPAGFLSTGNPTTPINAAMFPTSPSNWAAATFIMFDADNGTLGYTDSVNRHDGGELWIYLISNEGINFAGGTTGTCGSYYYLARVPRAKIQNLNIGDYQYFTGGDGSVDSNWSTSSAGAAAIITNTCSLSFSNVQYIPAINRYLLLTYSAPLGISTSTATTQWLGYESPHPWGTWTLVYASLDTALGAYNPIIIQPTALSGTTPEIMFTRNFLGGSADYVPFLAPLTINTGSNNLTVGVIPASLTANIGADQVSCIMQPLATGTLSSISMKFQTAPTTAAITIALATGIIPNLTLGASFTVTPAATTALQTFAGGGVNFPTTATTAGQYLCAWAATVTPGYGTDSPIVYFLGAQSTLPTGSHTYTNGNPNGIALTGMVTTP